VGLILATLLQTGLAMTAWAGNPRFYDLARKAEIDSEQALAHLRTRSIVLVGEHHTNADHHKGQLAVIRMLHAAGRPIAIGLEMFRAEHQDVLDQWISGTISPAEFEAHYYRNWNYPYTLYRPIFEFARRNRIAMIGLNISAQITGQVARQGFDSLSASQKQALGEVACRVDQAYMAFIRQAHGAHAHGNLNFTHFCEAQMVWDTVMALRSLDYLKANPGTTVVVLAGAGHAQKMGIPAQIRQRADWPLAVVMPHAPGSLDPQTLTTADADYILFNPESGAD